MAGTQEKPQFAADHYAPAHPEVMEAVIQANQGNEHSYGADSVTQAAEEWFRKTFGKNAQVYLVAGGGTAANVLALTGIVRSYESIICSNESHIFNDEAGAPEKSTGAHLQPLRSTHAKISPEDLSQVFYKIGDHHVSQPRILSLTQPTERGTIYSITELKELVRLAHDHNLFVHMDGARIFNAAAALEVELRALTTEVGIDVLSIGAGKNGGLGIGEAVVFLNPQLAKNFENIRKQAMQLVSKMRYLAAQWPVLFKQDLGLQLATQSNTMAARLKTGIENNRQVTISDPVETNGIWACLYPQYIETLLEKYDFYTWGNPMNHEVRWMTAYNTQPEQVDQFVADINQTTVEQA